MFDFNSLPENAQRLLDEAANLYWCGKVAEAELKKLEREHKRATKEIVDITRIATADNAMARGIERALIDLLGINKRDVWREIDRRAVECFGPYPTA